MAESGESSVADSNSMDIQIQSDAYSKDLLRSFGKNLDSEAGIGGLEEDIELTLGLSLNGRFGVDPRPPKLARSSSIPDFFNPSVAREASSEAAARHGFPAVASGNLMRTSSLPVEPEEELRKRKEMQSLRRMEAKRKRSEKQRNSIRRAAVKDRDGIERKASIPVPIRVSKGLSLEKLRNHSLGRVLSPECQIIEGMSKGGAEVRTPEWNGQTLSDQMESEPNKETTLVKCPSLGTGMKNQFKKLTVSDDGTKESLVRNAMLGMPYVSTQGNGPDGKRIEGVLYRYNKSEEVRIVCVCHGRFLSPAEFVKHAGGGTVVEQPLKHIVVTPSPLL